MMPAQTSNPRSLADAELIVEKTGVSGRVVDGAGRPVQGASVRAFGAQTLVPAGGDSLGVTAGPVPPISATGGAGLAFVTEGRTGVDGSFELEGLRPGD